METYGQINREGTYCCPLYCATYFLLLVTGMWCLTCTYRVSRQPDGSWLVHTSQGACRSLCPPSLWAWTLSLYWRTVAATLRGQSLQSDRTKAEHYLHYLTILDIFFNIVFLWLGPKNISYAVGELSCLLEWQLIIKKTPFFISTTCFLFHNN